jgi:hypothetical protein
VARAFLRCEPPPDSCAYAAVLVINMRGKKGRGIARGAAQLSASQGNGDAMHDDTGAAWEAFERYHALRAGFVRMHAL